MQLPRSLLVIYGLPNLTYSVAALPLALFVPSFYAGDLGLPLGAVGAAIAASRVLDLVIDPAIGTLSDRLQTRFGRRKPWIAIGTPILLLSTWRIFAPGAAGSVSLTYLTIWTALIFLGFTLIDLPYKAWGAELSEDYAERSRIAAFREGFGFAGQIGMLLLLVVLGRFGLSDARSQLWWIGLAILVLTPPLIALSLTLVPEPPPRRVGSERLSLVAGLGLLARDPALLRMVGSVLFFVAGVMIQGTLHRLVLEHATGAPDLFPVMIFFENLGTLAAVPLWLKLSDRLGKHRAIALAALWLALWSLPLPLFRPGQGAWMVAVVVIRGSSFASILFLANSLAADVVDHDLVASGEERTGLFFAIWAMVIKLAVAMGVLLGTAIPARFGFDPGAAAPSGEALWVLRAVYGWVPAALMALGAPFLWNFPITRKRQEALRAEIAARRI